MKKIGTLLLIVSGIGLVVWIVSKFFSRPPSTKQPVTNTNTASKPGDALYNLFSALRTGNSTGQGGKVDNTAAIVGASSAALTTGVKSIYDIFNPKTPAWQGPTQSQAFELSDADLRGLFGYGPDDFAAFEASRAVPPSTPEQLNNTPTVTPIDLNDYGYDWTNWN